MRAIPRLEQNVSKTVSLGLLSTQLSFDNKLLGKQSGHATNLYQAVPRSRGLDAKRHSLFGHGPGG